MTNKSKRALILIKGLFGFFVLVFSIFIFRTALSQSGTITAPTPSSYQTPTTTITPTPTTTTGSSGSGIIQPSPQIIHPQKDSQLAGNVVVEIFINATVVLEMNVYAVSPSNKNLYLGMARPTQGTYYQFWWDTKTVTNGDYFLYAGAKLSNGIVTYSPKIHLVVKNETQAPTETSADTGQVETASGTETQIQQGNQTTLIAQNPQTSVPVATPPPASNTALAENLLIGSKIVSRVEFSLDRDKPLHLEKIEGRLSAQNSRFLVFSGKAYADSHPTLIINSQPLVLSATADSSGNWTYTLENPLDAGKHEIFVEVDVNGKTEKSGPYPFSIAKAQATADNPTGASLELIDPQKQALKNYLYLASGLVGLAILIIAFYFYIKRVKKLGQNPAPNKEI